MVKVKYLLLHLSLRTCSFEQLCINYTNERLQQFFIHHVFKLEQDEYDAENINWSKVKFVDNQEIIDFIANAKLNVFALIDEETIFPKGTDLTFIRKLKQTHSKNKYLTQSTSKDELAFIIKHFAGDIPYTSKSILEKNRDTFSIDFRVVLRNCKNPFIREIFGTEDLENEQQSSKRTLASQFKRSMEKLMLLMSERHPYFVRCIKPNESKSASKFDRVLIVRQLRYSGMMETIRIRKLGFPIRYTFEFFMNRYYILLRSRTQLTAQSDQAKLASNICRAVLGPDDFQVGRSKVFLKDKANNDLEEARHRILSEGIIDIQTIIRNWASHIIFKKIRDATSLIQDYWRNNSEQRAYTKMRRGFMRLQAMVHSEMIAKRYDVLHSNIGYLQRTCRIYLVMNYNVKHMKDIIVLQQCAKNFLALSEIHHTAFKEDDIQSVEKGKAELERKLARTMGATRAKSEAEKKFLNRRDELAEKHSALEQFEIVEKDRKVDALDLIKAKRHHALGEEEIIDRAFQSLFDQEQRKSMEDHELELPEYKFPVFAKSHFRNKVSAVHTKAMLNGSLLEQENKLYEMGALSCWLMLLRFMGDIPIKKIRSRMKDQTMMKFLERNIAPKLQCEDNETMESLVKQHAAISMDLKGIVAAQFIPKVETTPFETMQYIIGVGVIVPQLRDEIYSQILKQLSGNESVSSFARGWILLSTVVAFFTPTQELLKYVQSFINSGPQAYSKYTMYKLNRCLKNGQRRQTPSFLECQTMKMRKVLEITVNAMDDTIVTVFVDSTTLGREVVGSVSAKLNIVEQDGFGISVSAFDSKEYIFDQDYILDGVSLCEARGLKAGVSFKSIPLRFVFMKIFFPPWEISLNDEKAINLIYKQLMRGIKHGEYYCSSEEELVSYAVQSYYADVGSKFTVSEVENFLKKVIFQEEYQNSRSRVSFMQQFQNTFKEIVPELKATYGDTDDGRKAVRSQMVENMKYRWPVKFSRYFKSVDLSGPTLSVDDADLVLTWKAIHLISDDKIITTFFYPEIVNFSSVVPHDIKRNKESFTMSTPLTNFVFSMKHVDRLRNTLQDLLDGLKSRSRYAMAIEDIDPAGRGKGTLQIRRGENDRNGREGNVLAKSVYIIPTGDRPTAKAMETLSTLAFKDISQFLIGDHADNSIFPLWEKFANRNIQLTRRGDNIIGKSVARISYQPTMLRHPLLLKFIEENPTGASYKPVAKQALDCFGGILRYGKIPDKGFEKEDYLQIIDSIFKPCLLPITSNLGPVYLLREELYCYILKQLTNCNDPNAFKRNWELLWLVTGLFAPRKEFADMLIHFFKSKDNKIAQSSLSRLLKIQKSGERKLPPTLIEIDSIQNRAYRLFHQIKFPDNSDSLVEIDCISKESDISAKLASSLKLVSPNEYALLIKTNKEVISITPEQYFFDFIRHNSDQYSKDNAYKATRDYRFKYQLNFIRKLWINIIPGEDVQADIRFHYPQESSKYLRGVYNLEIDDAVAIASLMYRAKHGDDTSRFATLIRAISEYIPREMISKLEPNEWQHRIEQSYLDNDGLSKDKAKIDLLKLLYKFPQFGTTYTDVKQTGNSSFPSRVMIGLSKRGATILDSNTKKELYHAPYTKDMEWWVSKGLFRFNLDSKTRLLCETNSENKLQELVKAYKDLLEVEVEQDSTLNKNDSEPSSKDNTRLFYEKESQRSQSPSYDTIENLQPNDQNVMIRQPITSHREERTSALHTQLNELRNMLNAKNQKNPTNMFNDDEIDL
ncbi:hypothetical protein GJ496_003139 [Pomphorhynchus laevis]|nr:hypothetical protein GJ496_003139 [Pomphorhynchus laevis]